MSAVTKSIPPDTLNDADVALLQRVSERFAESAGRPLFTTNVTGVWNTFLAYLPDALRRTYSCSACWRFAESYGSLVHIEPDGTTVSPIWTAEVPEVFAPAFDALRELFRRARVTGVFVSKAETLGTPVTGPWNHLAVTNVRPWTSRTLTAGQRMAELREDFGILQRSLAEFPLPVVKNAHNLLSDGTLYRSEKCLNVASWLLDLHEAREGAKGTRRDNLTWLAVATAPAGFCHVRTTMIGTLLEDLSSGMSFETVKSRFNAKMNPLQYQRPQAPPSAGNIAQAERLVAQLGIAPALERRFARLDEIETIWKPTPKQEESRAADGVFGHLKPKGSATHAEVVASPVAITWEKFARTVLPEAESIELQVPHSRETYLAIVTAANPDAPPILRWDREDRRNPFSWYVYNGGSLPRAWNLIAGTWNRVSAITQLPARWFGSPNTQDGDGVILVLEGARDVNYSRGAGFFPETLRGELHSVRATLEAYALQASISGLDESSACGLDLRAGAKWSAVVRVTTKRGVSQYQLDRWD